MNNPTKNVSKQNDRQSESLYFMNMKYLHQMKSHALAWGAYGSGIGLFPGVIAFFWERKPKWRPTYVPAISTNMVLIIGMNGMVFGGYFGTVAGMYFLQRKFNDMVHQAPPFSDREENPNQL